jgi:hypothetical protein
LGRGVGVDVGIGVNVGIFVGMGVEDGMGVLVAAAAVSAADVAASSSGEGPQDDINMQNSIKVNIRKIFFVKNIWSLLLLLSGFNETNKVSIQR